MSTSNSVTTLIRKVIIAYDESIAGREVLEWVNGHSVLLPTDEVIVVTVINEDGTRLEGLGGMEAPVLGGIEGSREYREMCRVLEEQGKERLAEAVYAIKQTGVKTVKAEVLKGHASEEIAKFAKEYKPDIVICGNRGHGFLKRKLIGSTSEYLTHHLDCAVMVVRTHTEQKTK